MREESGFEGSQCTCSDCGDLIVCALQNSVRHFECQCVAAAPSLTCSTACARSGAWRVMLGLCSSSAAASRATARCCAFTAPHSSTTKREVVSRIPLRHQNVKHFKITRLHPQNTKTFTCCLRRKCRARVLLQKYAPLLYPYSAKARAAQMSRMTEGEAVRWLLRKHEQRRACS